MNYSAWVERLHDFVNGWQDRLPLKRRRECFVHVDPPLTEEAIARLRNDLDCPLPPSVEGFLRQAASRIRFACICAPPGHAELQIEGELFNYWMWSPEPQEWEEQFVGPLEGMADAREHARSYAENSWLSDPEWVLDYAFWRHALPLNLTPGGDGLALWVHDPDHLDPPVLGLNHDDASSLLAPSFDEFLQRWEFLGYDMGEQYSDPETGFLDMTCQAAVARRALLGLKDKS